MREPAFSWVPAYTETYGDLAADVAVQVGMPMDPEQRLILDAIFAESSPGVPTCFEVGAIAPRQNLKTATLQVAALTDVFVLGEQLHVWTAHLFKTAVSAFEGMVRMIEGNDDFRSRCRKPRTANGDEAIELLTGERIEFHARSKGGGRGLTGDKITLDEGLFLSPSEMGALLPTLATRPGAQVRYASSAGLTTSHVLRSVRDRGRAGAESRLAYFEWAASRVDCAEPLCSHEVGSEGCALDRADLLELANPALGRRITLETLMAFRRSLPPHEFAREFLGWWDEPGVTEPVFGPGRWEACAGTGRPGDVKVGALGLAVSMDLTRGSIVAAGRGDKTFVKPLHCAPGTAWMVSRAKELQTQHQVDVIVDKRGPAAVLIPHLEREGVRLRVVETVEVLDSCAGIFDLVREQQLQHESYPELDAAVASAVKRDVGDRWAWGRKASGSDISALEAATLAAWGTTKQPTVSAYESRGVLTI